MATDWKAFSEKVVTGIKCEPNHDRYLLTVKYDDKIRRKIIDYSNKPSWKFKTRKEEIVKELSKFKALVTAKLSGEVTEDTKLDALADMYFKDHCNGSDWDKDRQRAYELHAKDMLGNTAIGTITQIKLDKLKSAMKSKGYGRQNADGCSNRTINKVIVQTIIPILKYGDIPLPNFKRQPIAKKKKVTNAKEVWYKLLEDILTRYEDTPYYRAMFLFALFGRRWNEIATLETRDIDILNNTYIIRAENSKIGEDQYFDMPPVLVTALMEHAPDVGLVFKSLITGRKTYSPKKQLQHIKTATGIEELTMHYFRHIYASVSVQSGLSVESVAASLGHTNTITAQKHYITTDNVGSSREITELLLDNKKLK